LDNLLSLAVRNCWLSSADSAFVAWRNERSTVHRC
jgi:hypothetical protein